MMTSRFVPFLGACASAALLALVGCGDDEPAETTPESPCPPGSTLTYQNFGQSFVQSYCLRCHSEALMGTARNGAPPNVNFNTVEQIRSEAEEMNEHAGVTNGVVNEDMPRNDPRPSVDERRQLSEWLACGAP